MKGANVTVGIMPLVDAAPIIAAKELGFAAQEGLTLELVKAPSWSTLRDMLVHGRVEAAHMLAPVPIALAMRLGAHAELDVLSVLSVNGTVVGVSNALAERLRSQQFTFDFRDAMAAGHALLECATHPLRIAVPFPFSMHAELLHYWLAGLGNSNLQAVEIKTIPPSLMAEAMAAGEIDAFCVGEPWGSMAVENGVGTLLLPLAAIWGFAPEKVLAVRKEYREAEPDVTERLTRAVWRAGKWLDQAENHMTASEILSRPEYVDVAPEILERAFEGRLVISQRGETRQVPNFLTFTEGSASFPWQSWAAWIAKQLASRHGLNLDTAIEAAKAVFRTDVYRAALAPELAGLPLSDWKIEGAALERMKIDSAHGTLQLEPDAFFDGKVFDPNPRS